MKKHTSHPALALLTTSAQPVSPTVPPPGLAKCGPRQIPGPAGTPKSKALRAQADATARAVVDIAFRRTGPTAVAAQIGLSRSVVRGWAEEGGLALTIRDILISPKGFARDVLEGALQVVTDDVPDTLDGLERLAGRLVCVAAELLRLADEAKDDSTTRKLILALLDRVEQIAQQIRRKLGLAAREG